MNNYLTDYQQCKRFAQGRARKLGNNTYLVVRDDGGYGIRLHDTEVVIHYPNHVILESGGWQTVTTKARMNNYSNAHVWSERGVWFVSWHGETYPFADGISLDNDGSVTGEGDDPKEALRLRKAVNKYAKGYAAAFLAGKVPAPNSGDCWGCRMVAEDGTAPMGGADHIHSHIADKYYVPSILNRMFDAGTLSVFAKDYIGRTWSPDHEPDKWAEDIAKEQIYKTVRKFCLRELGLPV